jgi:hypothetical protein
VAAGAEADTNAVGAELTMDESTKKKVEDWEAGRQKILVSILLAKFRQHIALGRQLMETGDSQIAYAEARNAEDGIGLALADPRAGMPTKWRGKNRLGEALVQVRQMLRGGEAEVTGAEATTVSAETISQAAYEEKKADQQKAGIIIKRHLRRGGRPT